MKTKALAASVVVVIGVVVAIIVANSGGVPDGRYESGLSGPGVPQAIAIDGNNFTLVRAGGMGTTFKYKYKDGTITLIGGAAGLSIPCEYKDGSLWFMGKEFKKS